ncbi:MAG TPA: DUF1552 domain-containing protein [Bryobacteraceae bacterium]|jgi:hypothetical protein|nr:DUF1552 domain-containing protein [Bryobacteraceae bacterium]
MRFITKKHLPRRTFLRSVGAAISLPLLDSMVPPMTALAATAANPKSRLGFIYVPHGAVMDKFTPAAEGAGFEFTPILSPLEPFRDRLIIVSGLANKAAESQGDGGGDHSRSAPSFLSGVHPKRTEGEDIQAGMTIDQIAAQRIGQDTPLPSLELGIEDTGLVGVCDVGYSCAYMNSIAWRTPSTPLPMEINPRILFERLFGDGSSTDERLANKQEDRSILDSVTKETGRLEKGLGARDRSRISEYLDNIREIERRIQKAETQASTSTLPVPETPIGVPESFEEHAKLMFDLQALAYQADITRVSTFMLARDLSQRTFPQIGVPEPHHATSHHGNNPATIAKLAKINNYHISLLAYFIGKLKATPDGDGTLLDHSMILYGSSMSNPNEHNHFPLPLLLLGGASGQLKGGRHLKFPERTPMSNMLLSVLAKSGVHMDKLGDSTGVLEI